MADTISGLHHVSAIAGPPQPNLDFYTGLLGMRLVKQTVNFDDPGTYHLYYGDDTGRPGTTMTFFPWPDAFQGKAGIGMVQATALSVPGGSLDFWMGRFADAAYDFEAPTERFGQVVLPLQDPDRLPIELVADAGANGAGRPEGAIPAEHAIRSFHSVTLGIEDPAPVARFLTDVFGYEEVGEEDGRRRVRSGGNRAAVVDLVHVETPGRMSKGAVHHVAFRAANEEEQFQWRERLVSLGIEVTEVKNRHYFRSIYFRDETRTGGVLFEVATDNPGFLVDESEEALGTTLKLPPWLEPRRERIERRLIALATR